MPLASKDGKLYVKTEIDENGNEVQKLCTTCCGPETGRCCVYTGEVLDMACGETRQECKDDAEAIAATDPNSFWSADNISFNPDPDADCPYSVFVYTIIPEASTPVCWDKDENGNPVTQEFCDAQSEGLKNTLSVFTAGEDCGETSIGVTGTCPPVPSEQRSNPLP